MSFPSRGPRKAHGAQGGGSPHAPCPTISPQEPSLALGLPSPAQPPLSFAETPPRRPLDSALSGSAHTGGGRESKLGPSGLRPPSPGPRQQPPSLHRHPAQHPQPALLLKTSGKNAPERKGLHQTTPPPPQRGTCRGIIQRGFCTPHRPQRRHHALLRSRNLQPGPGKPASLRSLCVQRTSAHSERESRQPRSHGKVPPLPARTPLPLLLPPNPLGPRGEGLLQRCSASGRTHPESEPQASPSI